MKTLAVLTVATRHYYEYWERMVRSAEHNLCDDIKVNFHVFTDRYDSVSNFRPTSPHVTVTPHEIENFGWPEATIKRYQIILKFQEEFTEDYLLHLDADMLFKTSLSTLFEELDLEKEITLVLHPGYYRPKRLLRIKFYLQYPRYSLVDCKLKLKLGGVGAWETNKKSRAYVARKYRKHYFCGATWFGPRSKVLEFSDTLAKNVDIDMNSGIMAKWHDESHLNHWAAENNFNILPPSFCFDPTMPQLRKLKEFIRAVDKKKDISSSKI